MIITGIEADKELAVYKSQLLGSLLLFVRTFFKAQTGREFVVSTPSGRESHHITICRSLTQLFNLEETRLVINVPPGHGKSTLLQYFVAWSWAHYPDAKFLYISYSHDEASKNTAMIRSLVSLPLYRKMFGVQIDQASSAKDDFKTTQGGAIIAFGSGGAVTGKDAGFPGCDRFSGMLIMDDMHKPDEVHSDTMRTGVTKNYKETIAQRPRSPNVPQVFIGQRLHEDDVAAFFISGSDGYDWGQVVLKGMDDAGNALDPGVKTAEELKKLEEFSPYVYWSQYQQQPQPAGGGIFKTKDFMILDEEPKLITTFITADTAETSKSHNDASVFSFWGLYKVDDFKRGELDLYAIHCIDCIELRVEPKMLESEFLSFYSECCMHKQPPSFVAIEKKSTGVTLISVLSDVRGLIVRDIKRSRASGSKIDRFLEIQQYVGKKLVSLPKIGKHTDGFIEHCSKITANNTHRHDDIADTLYDAIKIALIDKSLQIKHSDKSKNNPALQAMINKSSKINSLRAATWR